MEGLPAIPHLPGWGPSENELRLMDSDVRTETFGLGEVDDDEAGSVSFSDPELKRMK